jgi:hypothetical protein
VDRHDLEGMMGFALDLQRFALKAANRQQQVHRRLLFLTAQQLVMTSPVGDPALWSHPAPHNYHPGTFRASWQHGIGSVPSAAATAPDPDGHATLERLRSSIDQSPGGIDYLVNTAPYARAIEYGHSTQAPHGVLSRVIVNFPQLVRQAAKEGA